MGDEVAPQQPAAAVALHAPGGRDLLAVDVRHDAAEGPAGATAGQRIGHLLQHVGPQVIVVAVQVRDHIAQRLLGTRIHGPRNAAPHIRHAARTAIGSAQGLDALQRAVVRAAVHEQLLQRWIGLRLHRLDALLQEGLAVPGAGDDRKTLHGARAQSGPNRQWQSKGQRAMSWE